MKNIVDNKTQTNHRSSIIVAYVSMLGFVYRAFPNKAPITFVKRRQVKYEP